MDNQHKKIKGYRDLSQEEIDLMNEAKALAEQCGALCDKLQKAALKDITEPEIIKSKDILDALNWLKVGKTDLQKGFMSVIRSIARPTTF